MGGVELLEIVVAGAFGTFRFYLHKLLFYLICLMYFSHAFLFHFEGFFFSAGMGEVVGVDRSGSRRNINSFLLDFIPSFLPAASFCQQADLFIEGLLLQHDVFGPSLVVLHEDLAKIMGDLNLFLWASERGINGKFLFKQGFDLHLEICFWFGLLDNQISSFLKTSFLVLVDIVSSEFVDLLPCNSYL